ncbi:DUF5681 domain-containing protein [Bradyrhizobium sp. ORS 111]|uniref:DUF5681 domain-containing protein n=1 Tax=Bradyrhizobium sp. ORS 111 TaxID=1685958 RepID=UPI00388F78CB
MTGGDAENSTGKQRGRPFQRGRSGNPAGKPKGTRNATTVALEALLDGEAEELTRKAIELAKGGDMAALRLCMERIVPPRRDRPVTFEMPAITQPAEAAAAMASILVGVSAGQITPGEASEVAKLVEAFVKAVEIADLAARIDRLERMTSQ